MRWTAISVTHPEVDIRLAEINRLQLAMHIGDVEDTGVAIHGDGIHVGHGIHFLGGFLDRLINFLFGFILGPGAGDGCQCRCANCPQA